MLQLLEYLDPIGTQNLTASGVTLAALRLDAKNGDRFENGVLAIIHGLQNEVITQLLASVELNGAHTHIPKP